MLKYENHDFEGKAWISVESDSNRFVVCDGSEYTCLWMLKPEEKPCVEGNVIPESDDIDEAEAYNIIFGGAE